MKVGGWAYRCNRCGETKPLDQFYVSTTSGHVTGYCKPCQRAYMRDYAATLDAYARERMRAARRLAYAYRHRAERASAVPG